MRQSRLAFRKRLSYLSACGSALSSHAPWTLAAGLEQLHKGT